MNSRTALLRETATWMDTIDLGLCMFIYGVCNEYQFDYVSGSDFVNFMNLKPTARDVSVRPKENLRVCYMVLAVSQTIRPRERGRLGRRSSSSVAAYRNPITTSTEATCAPKAPPTRTGNTART